MSLMKRMLSLLLVFISAITFAQETTQVVQNYLDENRVSLSLTNDDIQDWIITDEIYSERSQLTHVYIQQRHGGIPIYNAVANISIKDGQVVHSGISFIPDARSKVNASTPSISPNAAIQKMASAFELGSANGISLVQTNGVNNFVYSKSGISAENIPVELVYQESADKKLILSWRLSALEINGIHWWDARIDANTGVIVDSNDWNISCQFDMAEVKHDHQRHVRNKIGERVNRSLLFTGENYNVFALPLESPNHGSRSIVTNAFTTNASPFGWHDNDGVEGADFTITRGNNVYAQLDDDANNNTFGLAPDGGSSLTFDFPYDDTLQPDNYTEASVTNLFYLNNVFHDIMFNYGFDEISGNFQDLNYSGEGDDGDYVIADAQDASGTNNANFATPRDGFRPRMQMFLWDRTDDLLTINSGSVAGSYPGNDSNFNNGFNPPSQTGVPLLGNPVTADLMVVDDGSANPTEACETIQNDLTGKIAVIRRGNCSFVDKVRRAQTAGALAAIIVNNTDGQVLMGGVTLTVNIPAISISQVDGEAVIAALDNGETLNATLEDPGLSHDSSFDNGIIAHEYGHGVSNRLIGGPGTTGCMGNAEQLGEGWSDFFGYIITMRPGDAADLARGIGTFAADQPIDGNGIRQFPYTTDMSVNPFTFDNVQDQTAGGNVSVHGVGSIWATMLWDLTWALIDEYGWDPDIYNGSGGNNKVLELVIEGLKLTPCNSGFIGARDAILAADEAINGGANACLIWGVFANRGLGYSATGGSTNSIADQTEAFDLPPTSELNCALSVTDIGARNFTIYPNPSNGSLSISVINDVENAQVSIYDLNGREVYFDRVDIYGSVNINASKLATGMYVLKISNGTTSFSQKIIIR